MAPQHGTQQWHPGNGTPSCNNVTIRTCCTRPPKSSPQTAFSPLPHWKVFFPPEMLLSALSHEARNKAAEQQEFKVPIYRTGNESRFIVLVDVSGNVETNLPTIKSERWHVWESWMSQASTRTKGKNCFSMFFPFPCRKGVTVPGAWFWPNGPAACLCRFRFPPRLPRRRLLSVMAGLKRGCIVKNLAQLRVDDPKIQLVVNVSFSKNASPFVNFAEIMSSIWSSVSSTPKKNIQSMKRTMFFASKTKGYVFFWGPDMFVDFQCQQGDSNPLSLHVSVT